MECKVRRFILSMRGQAQFNFVLLKAKVIDVDTEPLKVQWHIPGHNPHKTKRNTDTKTFEKNEESKQYKVVFHKRVLDPDSFQSYPYGYTRTELHDLSMGKIDILVGL